MKPRTTASNATINAVVVTLPPMRTRKTTSKLNLAKNRIDTNTVAIVIDDMFNIQIAKYNWCKTRIKTIAVTKD